MRKHQRKILTTGSVKSKGSKGKPQQESEGRDVRLPRRRFCSLSAGSRPLLLPEPWGKRIVVLIPAYNCANCLPDAFESLLQQTLDRKSWGVLLIDDSSPDAASAACRKYGAVHIRFSRNRGKAAAVNFACGILADETIIAALDADDALMPEALMMIDQRWKDVPEAALVYTNYMVCNCDLAEAKVGHGKSAGTSLNDAGWISHLKTYRVRDLLKAGGMNETVRKAIDKDLVYRLQEVAEEEGRPIEYVPEVLYLYRRRKEGSITFDRALDATKARRTAIRRRAGIADDVLCVYSAGQCNDTGGPGIFWSLLLEEIANRQEEVFMTEDPRESDVILGNIRIEPSIDHQRPWVVRLDGVHFNSREDYRQRNVSLMDAVACGEGVVYQSRWGKDMADEYLGATAGMAETIPNGTKVPDGFRKNDNPKSFVTCARWGISRKRMFKRLDDTIEGFVTSGLSAKGYKLVVLGETEIRNAGQNVDFRGRVSRDDVWKTLQDAIALVHLSWFDCCPNSVVEALAVDVPIIYCADGVAQLVSGAGWKVPDNLVNHPCNIDQPPGLNIREVALAMEAAVVKKSDFNFPDVSMKTCADKYIEFLRRVHATGLKTVETSRGRLTRIVASTENMR